MGAALSFVDAPGPRVADDDAPSISALSFDSGTPRTARMRLK